MTYRTRTNLPALSHDSGLSQYLETIRKFPMLEAQEEYDLAKSWRESEDKAAAHKLVTSHLRLVAKIAMTYKGYGLPVADLIAEGNIGMMQAVKKFDPELGFRLATYAIWWIKASIQEYILRSWSLVKIGTTAAQKKLFFNLQKLKKDMKALETGDLTPEHVQEISQRLSVSEQEVIDMNRRLSSPDHSLNANIKSDGEGDSSTWQDFLVDENQENQEDMVIDADEKHKRMSLLKNALAKLNTREREIFYRRRLVDDEDQVTLEDLSQEYQISRERVRQIENRAFEKLSKDIQLEAGQLKLLTQDA